MTGAPIHVWHHPSYPSLYITDGQLIYIPGQIKYFGLRQKESVSWCHNCHSSSFQPPSTLILNTINMPPRRKKAPVAAQKSQPDKSTQPVEDPTPPGPPSASHSQITPAATPSPAISGTMGSSQINSIINSTDTDTPKTGKKNLQWTGAMEKSALKLYSAAVLAGKKSDGGFKSDVHQMVAAKLNEEYPGSDFAVKRCKSKLSQVSSFLPIDLSIFTHLTNWLFSKKTFKKEYNAFVACKNASGFGWDEVRCEVTASNEVWENFILVKHFCSFIYHC